MSLEWSLPERHHSIKIHSHRTSSGEETVRSNITEKASVTEVVDWGGRVPANKKKIIFNTEFYNLFISPENPPTYSRNNLKVSIKFLIYSLSIVKRIYLTEN